MKLTSVLTFVAAMIVKDVLMTVFMNVVMILAIFSTQLNIGSHLTSAWQLWLVSVTVEFFTGRWIARHAKGNGIAVCLVWISLQFVFQLHPDPLERSHAALFNVSRILSLFAGATLLRRNSKSPGVANA